MNKYDAFLNGVYDSMYAPGPVLKASALLAGAYVGLCFAAILHHKLK